MKIPGELLERVVEHCLQEVPYEACGVLSGPVDGSPDQHHPMANGLVGGRALLAFEFVPSDQLRLFTELDEAGRRPLVIYHSHTKGMAYPSIRDIANASLQVHSLHLIVATERLDPGLPLGLQNGAIRLFKIGRGVVTQEPIELVVTQWLTIEVQQ